MKQKRYASPSPRPRRILFTIACTAFLLRPATVASGQARAVASAPIAVSPGYARFLAVQGEPQREAIAETLWSRDGTAFDIERVDATVPFVRVEFHEATAAERAREGKGKQWRVEISLSEDAAVGPLNVYVVVHTNHPEQRVVQIPVSGLVRPMITVTPPAADFGAIELNAPLTSTLRVHNFATAPVHLTAVESSLRGVHASIESVQDGREYLVRLTLSPEIGQGRFSGTVRIHTDSAKMPTLVIAVTGNVR